jgi:hypothetical protein
LRGTQLVRLREVLFANLLAAVSFLLTFLPHASLFATVRVWYTYTILLRVPVVLHMGKYELRMVLEALLVLFAVCGYLSFKLLDVLASALPIPKRWRPLSRGLRPE